MTGSSIKDACDGCAAVAAAAVAVFGRHVPGREFVPVATDQDIATVVTVGTRAVEIVNIARIDVAESVFQCDVAGPRQRC